MNDRSEQAVTDVVQRERRGSALWIWLNRPEVLNAVSVDVLDGIDAALAVARVDDSVHAVVIAGRGRLFCAGADLNHVQSLLGADVGDGLSVGKQAFLRRVAQTFDAVEAFPKPVIASVHGLAVAGGLELVLCCDFVIAGRSASFGDGHANFGLVPGAGGSIRLPRRVGPGRAKRMLFTGDAMSAEELADTDLVEMVVEDDQLLETVEAVVERMASKSPVVTRVTKALVNDGLQVPLDIALRMEISACELLEQSYDEREGVSAFLEKRTPHFLGR